MKKNITLKKNITRILSMILSACLGLAVTGCGQARDLTKNIPANTATDNHVSTLSEEELSAGRQAAMDFTVTLLQHSMANTADTNICISPISVLYALCMTANGAKGNTLAEMEEMFGADTDTMNAFLSDFLHELPSEKKCRANIANSIWFNEDSGITYSDEFLRRNRDFYDAAIYEAVFNQHTQKQINQWVKENTGGLIPEVIKELSPQTVMYLINAVAFDAEWQNIYENIQVSDDTFTLEDGTTQSIKLMHNMEYMYLEGEQETGFLKPYAGDRYAYAALLPDENIKLADYVNGLSGEKLSELLANVQPIGVTTAIPKYHTEYGMDLEPVLTDMGMTDAFSAELADFSGIGISANGLFIDTAIHKSYMAVDEKGTKAGAVTVIEIKEGAAMSENKVILNRPFVYMIIDTESMIPLFIGTVCEIN